MSQTRCCICKRFMSDDDVLLGMSRDIECGQEYAHSECVSKMSEKEMGRIVAPQESVVGLYTALSQIGNAEHHDGFTVLWMPPPTVHPDTPEISHEAFKNLIEHIEQKQKSGPQTEA